MSDESETAELAEALLNAHPEEVQRLVEASSNEWEAELAQGVAKMPNFGGPGALPDDFAIVRTRQIEDTATSFEVAWLTKGAGWGAIRFTKREDGRLDCENEGMSKGFCLKVLSFFGWAQITDRCTLPALWLEFGGLHGLLTAAVPREEREDWGQREPPQ